jgi:ABC-type nitrate/sulfonate/bicarbonate transport system permease component
MWPFARRFAGPALELLRPLPIPAVIPPLIVLLGVDNPMKVTVVAITAFYPLLINTTQGLHSLDPVLLALARTLRLGTFARIGRIVVPASLPFVLTGVRISLALALITAVIAEMIAGDSGIGHYLILMQYATRAADMYAAVVLLAVAGYALNRVVSIAEGRALFWQQTRVPA